MRRLLLILLLLAASFAGATACPAGYAGYLTLTLPAQTGQSGDLTNKDAVFLGNALLATVANGGHVSSTGTDVVFCTLASSTTCTVGTVGTILPYEFVSTTYVAATGAGEWWVQTPTVSHTTTKLICAAVGKASASDLSCGPSGTNNCGANLWANFLFVQHWGSSSSLSLTDSSGTCAGLTNTGVTATTGLMGGASNFVAGSSTHIASTCGVVLTAYSLETWMAHGSNGTSTEVWGDSVSLSGHELLGYTNGITGCTASGSHCASGGYGDGGAYFYRESSSDIGSGNTWHHIVTTHVAGSASNVTLYFDGASQAGSTQNSGSPVDPGTVGQGFGFGYQADGNHFFYQGWLDESRLSTQTFSADWVLFDYNNQSQQTIGTFTVTGSFLTPTGFPQVVENVIPDLVTFP
jgi:hypothetical protein